MSIHNKIQTLKDDLYLFHDELDKYEYIIDLGKKLQPLSSAEQIDKYKVHGCSSNVWLIPSYENDIFSFRANSDTAIVRGLVSIIIYSSHTSQRVLF